MKRFLSIVLALTISCQAIAQVSINQLPAASTLGGTEKIPTAQGSGCATNSTPCATRATTPAQIAVYVAGSTAITSSFQPLDSDLTSLAALSTTAYGRSLLATADAAGLRTLGGLGTLSTQSAASVSITGGSIAGITDLALADGGTGASLSDPGADRIVFWDDSASATTWLTLGTGLSITGTTINAAASLADADYGDITVASSGNAWSIDAGTIGTAELGGDVTAAGEALLDDANATAQRATLGLGTAALSASGDFLASSAASAYGLTLIDDADATAARATLGLGSAATSASTAFQAADSDLTIFAGITPSADVQSLLAAASDAAFQSDLGLGSAALNATADFQAADAELAALAGLTSAADKLAYFSGSGTAALANFSAANRSALAALAGTNTGDQDLSSYATTAAVSAGYQPLDADLTSIAALTTTAFGRGLLDDADAAAGRASFSLGTSSTVNTGTSGATIPLLNVANTWGADQTFGNQRLVFSYAASTPASGPALIWGTGGNNQLGLYVAGGINFQGNASNPDVIIRSTTTDGTLGTSNIIFGGDSGNVYIATGINLGHASDTTITRSAAGVLAVEGVTVPLNSTSSVHTASTIELGAASDTTLSRSSAGLLAVEGVNVLLNGGALGTPSSATLTNATGLPVAGITSSTSTALGVGSLEVGAASDTTITRVSAGVIAVEGTTVAPLVSPVFTGVMYWQQGAPTAKNSTTTLTIAEVLGGIITTTSASAVALTLPTGTNTDAGILSGALANDRMFDWYVINLGSSSGAMTLTANTAHTIVGNAVCAIATTCHWGTRKTATNTYVTYRL